MINLRQTSGPFPKAVPGPVTCSAPPDSQQHLGPWRRVSVRFSSAVPSPAAKRINGHLSKYSVPCLTSCQTFRFLRDSISCDDGSLVRPTISSDGLKEPELPKGRFPRRKHNGILLKYNYHMSLWVTSLRCAASLVLDRNQKQGRIARPSALTHAPIVSS
jgi:hypothetical protein